MHTYIVADEKFICDGKMKAESMERFVQFMERVESLEFRLNKFENLPEPMAIYWKNRYEQLEIKYSALCVKLSNILGDQ
jgi:hypothetical protein